MQSNSDPTHIAYADETHYNTGQYRGIALVSLKYENAAGLNSELQNILQGSGITEFKWHKLDNARYRFAALKMLDYAVRHTCAKIVRADMLTWDIEDSRHRITGRDDIANLQRMYYHLLKNVLRTRWPADSIWRLCPDEQAAMKWNEVKDFLDMTSTQVDVRRDLFTQGKFRLRLRQEFDIEQITPCKSHQEPLIQLADLCAGLAAYSRSSYDIYEQWKRSSSQQVRLFATTEQESPPELSNSDHARCQVLAEFDGMCKKQRLGVSLKTDHGLRTFGPINPINFWWYEPQHEGEKAPVKGAL